MQTINIARLRDGLCGYLARVRAGEEIVIRDRNRPVARLVPFAAETEDAEEERLVAAGQLKLPERPLDVGALLKIPAGRGRLAAVIAATLAERGEDR